MGPRLSRGLLHGPLARFARAAGSARQTARHAGCQGRAPGVPLVWLAPPAVAAANPEGLSADRGGLLARRSTAGSPPRRGSGGSPARVVGRGRARAVQAARQARPTMR